MKKAVIAALTFGLIFGVSVVSAQKPEGPGFLMAWQADGSLGGDLDEPAGVPDSMISIDITGIENFDGLDDPDNTILIEAVGVDCIMTGIGWDVTLSTVGASWLSEAVTYFDGVDLDGMGLFLTVGVGDDMPGTATYSSGGIIDLTDNGIPNIPFPDGDLYMQFHESFVDNPNAADSTYLATSTYDIAGIFCAGDTSGAGPMFDVTGIPTLSQVGLVILLLLLATVGLILVRRQPSL